MTSKTKQETAHMAGKKKVVEVEMTVAEKMKANYEKLALMNEEIQANMQAAYRFAMDNNLIYTAPSVVRDDGDYEDYEDSYESSYC